MILRVSCGRWYLPEIMSLFPAVFLHEGYTLSAAHDFFGTNWLWLDLPPQWVINGVAFIPAYWPCLVRWCELAWCLVLRHCCSLFRPGLRCSVLWYMWKQGSRGQTACDDAAQLHSFRAPLNARVNEWCLYLQSPLCLFVFKLIPKKKGGGLKEEHPCVFDEEWYRKGVFRGNRYYSP